MTVLRARRVIAVPGPTKFARPWPITIAAKAASATNYRPFLDKLLHQVVRPAASQPLVR